MKTIVRVLVLLPVAIVVLAFSFANRHSVNVSFDPFDGAASMFDISAPLFVILFAAIMLGVLIGGIASWFSQGKHRRAERQHRADAERLRAELERVTADAGSSQPGKSFHLIPRSGAA